MMLNGQMRSIYSDTISGPVRKTFILLPEAEAWMPERASMRMDAHPSVKEAEKRLLSARS